MSTQLNPSSPDGTLRLPRVQSPVDTPRESALHEIIREERRVVAELRSRVMACEIRNARLEVRAETLAALVAEAVRVVAMRDLDAAARLNRRLAAVVSVPITGASDA